MAIDAILPTPPPNPLIVEDDFRLEPTWADPKGAFGLVLRQARLKLSLSRREFARLVGMHPTNLRGCEWGWQVPAMVALPRVIALAEQLSCPDLVAAFHASHEVMAREQHRALRRAEPLAPEPAPVTGYLTPLPHLRRLDIVLVPAPRP